MIFNEILIILSSAVSTVSELHVLPTTFYSHLIHFMNIIKVIDFMGLRKKHYN